MYCAKQTHSFRHTTISTHTVDELWWFYFNSNEFQRTRYLFLTCTIAIIDTTSTWRSSMQVHMRIVIVLCCEELAGRRYSLLASFSLLSFSRKSEKRENGRVLLLVIVTHSLCITLRYVSHLPAWYCCCCCCHHYYYYYVREQQNVKHDLSLSSWANRNNLFVVVVVVVWLNGPPPLACQHTQDDDLCLAKWRSHAEWWWWWR